MLTERSVGALNGQLEDLAIESTTRYAVQNVILVQYILLEKLTLSKTCVWITRYIG